MKWLDSITDSMVMNLKILWETVKERTAWPTAVHGVAETEHLNSNNNKPRLPAIWRHRLMEKTPREALLCSSVAVFCSRRHFQYSQEVVHVIFSYVANDQWYAINV